MFIEVALFHKPPPSFSLKNFWLYLRIIIIIIIIIIFAKRSVLDICQCSEYVCLHNCSVIRTVTWRYELHQTHSE